MSAATQFCLNTDLGFTTVIAFSRAPPNETPVLSAKFAKIGGGGSSCKLPRIPTSDNEPLTFHLRYIPSPGCTYCQCRWHEQHGIAVIITRYFLHTEEEKSEVDITSSSSIDFPLPRRWSHDSHSQPPRPAPVNEN